MALGRKNFLFVGDEDSGANIAGLYSLAATCEARGINPLAYFTDVLTRVGDHPTKQLDDLLPAAWSIQDDGGRTVMKPATCVNHNGRAAGPGVHNKCCHHRSLI